MNNINISHVNAKAAYTLWQQGNRYLFKTDFNIIYAISFDPEETFPVPSYWFNLSNVSNKKSPGDKKIAQTIICIIEGFFESNPNILLYMCDTANDQQAQRDRLFLHWFNGYRQKEKYAVKSAVVNDEGTDNYVSIIVQRNNPHVDEILAIFDAQISMFNQDK